MEVGLMMLDAGKHVLCEKPLGINEKQVKIIIDRADEKKLFLMEGVWSRFFPSYTYLKEQIDLGNIGTVTEVDISFGFDVQSPRFDRYRRKAQGGGAILCWGVYPI